MNLLQIELLQKSISGLSNQLNMEVTNSEPAILFSSQKDSAGGRGTDKSGSQEIEEHQASDSKREKDSTGKAQGEEITNKANDERENASITEPDTNLTGDTGNLDIGQTDLGASGTGAEDL